MTEIEAVTGQGGVGLAAYDFGGDGRPLVLAHATGLHAHTLAPMVEGLRSRFHCYGFDARGHGASGLPPDGDFDWDNSAQDLLAVVAHFGLERPFGFGHSFGGALLVLSEQTRPGTWRALFAYEPITPPTGRLGPDNPLAAGARRRRAEFPSRQAALENFAVKPPFAALSPGALAAYVEYGFVTQADGTVALACRPESEAATYEAAPRHRAYDRLSEVRCPVTVAGGADSTHISPDLMRDIADRLPHGHALIMAGRGHFGPLEDPPGVAGAVTGSLYPAQQ